MLLGSKIHINLAANALLQSCTKYVITAQLKSQCIRFILYRPDREILHKHIEKLRELQNPILYFKLNYFETLLDNVCINNYIG